MRLHNLEVAKIFGLGLYFSKLRCENLHLLQYLTAISLTSVVVDDFPLLWRRFLRIVGEMESNCYHLFFIPVDNVICSTCRNVKFSNLKIFSVCCEYILTIEDLLGVFWYHFWPLVRLCDVHRQETLSYGFYSDYLRSIQRSFSLNFEDLQENLRRFLAQFPVFTRIITCKIEWIAISILSSIPKISARVFSVFW